MDSTFTTLKMLEVLQKDQVTQATGIEIVIQKMLRSIGDACDLVRKYQDSKGEKFV